MQGELHHKSKNQHQNQKADCPNNDKADDWTNNLGNYCVGFCDKLKTLPMGHIDNVTEIRAVSNDILRNMKLSSLK